VEDTLLSAPDPVLLRMLPQVHTIVRVTHGALLPVFHAASPQYLTERSIKSIVLD
jgi:hypothetical protein